MKRDKLSFLVLFVEILAIALLHFAKDRHTDADKMAANTKKAAATYQLNTLQVSRLK